LIFLYNRSVISNVEGRGLVGIVVALPKYQKTWVVNNGVYLLFNYLH